MKSNEIQVSGLGYATDGMTGMRLDMPKKKAIPTSLGGWDWDMAKAPKDGTLLCLLIGTEGRDHALKDADAPTPTIGFNNLKDTEVDVWRFAGWDWYQDCFTEGVGVPIAWRHYPGKE